MKNGAKNADKVNPYLNRRAIAYVKSAQTSYLYDVYANVESILGKIDPETSEQLGDYLKYVRIAVGGCGEIWSPGGESAETSQKMMEYLERKLGHERFALLEKAASEFAKLRYEHVVKEVAESGTFSKAYVEKVLNNKAYATFDVLHTLGKKYGADAISNVTGVPVGAHEQVGTTADIRNPFTATLENDMKMMAFIDRNNLNKNTVALLRNHKNTLGFTAIKQERMANGEIAREIGGDIGTLIPIGPGSLHPALKVTTAVGTYIAGDNPADYFHGQKIIPQGTYKDGTPGEHWAHLGKFVKANLFLNRPNDTKLHGL